MSRITVKEYFSEVLRDNELPLYKCRGCKKNLELNSIHSHIKRTACNRSFEEFKKKKKQERETPGSALCVDDEPCDLHGETTYEDGSELEDNEVGDVMATDEALDAHVETMDEGESDDDAETTDDEDAEDVCGDIFPDMLAMTEEDNEAIYLGCVADDAEDYGGDQDLRYPEWNGDKVQQYRCKLQHPLYEGPEGHCRVKLIDAIFFLLKMKHVNRLGHKVLDCFIHSLHSFLLPSNNILPPSLHLCKRVLGVDKWHKFERHVCDNEGCSGYLYDHLDRAQWKESDTCPLCNQTRFVRVGSSDQLKPRYWFIHLGLESALDDFFEDTWWVEQLGQQRDESVQGSFWASEEWRRIKGWVRDHMHEDFKPKLFSLYDLLLDWLEPYNSCQHSTGLMSIR
jgi:hypothetical protein